MNNWSLEQTALYILQSLVPEPTIDSAGDQSLDTEMPNNLCINVLLKKR